MATSSDSRPVLFDHVIRSENCSNTLPLLAYPREGTVADFEYFTARDLDLLVDRAAQHYLGLRLDPSKEPIVSLIGPSNLDYIISQFALSRLGFGLLFLSTRLSPEACLKLMRESNSHTVIQSSSPLAFNLGHRVRKSESSVHVHPMVTSDVYRDIALDSLPKIPFDSEEAIQKRQHDTAVVYHSSGSTGLPKSIPTSHVKLLARISPGKGSRVMTASPIFHAYASKLTINCMIEGKCMFLPNAEIAQTNEGLVEMCEKARPDVFFAVPYNLKLLAESPSGIEALRSCSQVVSSGSQLSDELGNRLIQAGINIETLFAGTEPGLVGTSMNRPPDDLAWDYIRLSPSIIANTHYKPLGSNTFEFVYLCTLPTLNVSNSADPPGSFHSSDIFTPHASIPHAWKFLGRADDRVTLSTGEKVLPLLMEGRVKEEPLVREAVVFGIDRALPGLLLFRSDAATTLAEEEFLHAVWPAIQAANKTSETFAQIAKEMVVILPAGTQVPIADKGNMLRAQVYEAYKEKIGGAYDALENASAVGDLVLGAAELEDWMLRLLKDELDMKVEDGVADLYQMGLDSLRAAQLRGSILRRLDLGTAASRLTPSAIFQAGTVKGLAQMCIALREGEDQRSDSSEEHQIQAMQEMLEKHSKFDEYQPKQENPKKKPTDMVILLTGATGSLGAHLLAQLLARADVRQVYSLVRGANPLERIQQSLRTRHLAHNAASISTKKLVALSSTLSDPNLGLEPNILTHLRDTITHIIHAAWPVNFNLALSAFEPHILGLHNLLHLSLSSSSSARLLFCSSISTALATPVPPSGPTTTIPSTPLAHPTQSQPSGYARSKFIGEGVVAAARTHAGADAVALRIGQVIGDTGAGVWSDGEAWPLVLRSARALGVLPELDIVCSWLPVDTAAGAIVDLMRADDASGVYNVQNPRAFHWTRDLLPVLRDAGLRFEAVRVDIWLARMRRYSECVAAEEAQRENPAVKLLEYFERTFGAPRGGEVMFDTAKAERCSAHLRSAPDVLASGLMARTLQVWLEKWAENR